MARVLALIPDLLFGSHVQAALLAAGHRVQIVGDEPALRKALSEEPAEVLVVDLTDERFDGVGRVSGLTGNDLRVLGFYAHVEPQVRQRALDAGFDVVVPRSRMARETARLVEELLV